MSTWGAAIRGTGVQFAEFFSQNTLNLTDGWSPVVKYESDNNARMTVSGKTGAGTLSMFAEGASVPGKNRYKLYNTEFTHKQYGGYVSVTRLTVMNRMFAQAFDEFKDLTASAAVTRSKAPAQIFNMAFANAGVATENGIQVTTYADTKNLASTAHPRVDGGSSQSNASATGIPLTEANLETGRLALVKQLQDDGTPIANMGQLYLVVPMALEKTAKIITQSNLRSGTPNNDTNVYAGGSIQVMSSVWLDAINGGSDTQWALVSPSVARLVMVERTKPTLDQSVDKLTKTSLFDVIYDFSVGSKDWRGTWFSKGDSAAYSS